jgi:hypothetical protein
MRGKPHNLITVLLAIAVAAQFALPRIAIAQVSMRCGNKTMPSVACPTAAPMQHVSLGQNAFPCCCHKHAAMFRSMHGPNDVPVMAAATPRCIVTMHLVGQRPSLTAASRTQQGTDTTDVLWRQPADKPVVFPTAVIGMVAASPATDILRLALVRSHGLRAPPTV